MKNGVQEGKRILCEALPLKHPAQGDHPYFINQEGPSEKLNDLPRAKPQALSEPDVNAGLTPASSVTHNRQCLRVSSQK